MIPVHKPEEPAGLKKGRRRTRQDCAAFEAHRLAYLTGTRDFTFGRGIYAHDTVKAALRKAQHDKCCFCEGKFSAQAYGDVEHYRPKGSVTQASGHQPLRPGYFWLAYSWENLFWSCQICNRRKRDLFPLIDPAKRARSCYDDVATEAPLIIDPGGPDDPRDHIRFRGEAAEPTTECGRVTIDVVGLNRPTLTEERLTWLQRIRHLWFTIQALRGNSSPAVAVLLTSARREIEAAVEPTSRFSAMAADYLSSISDEKPL